METDDSKVDNKPTNRHPLLIVAAVVAVLAVLTIWIVLGFLAAPPIESLEKAGAPVACNSIQRDIDNDKSQIQTLQTLEAGTSNPAQTAKIHTLIAGIQQDIAALQTQTTLDNCP